MAQCASNKYACVLLDTRGRVTLVCTPAPQNYLAQSSTVVRLLVHTFLDDHIANTFIQQAQKTQLSRPELSLDAICRELCEQMQVEPRLVYIASPHKDDIVKIDAMLRKEIS